VTYEYDANNLLTAVRDNEGVLLEGHTYDAEGRGLTSTRAGGVESVAVSYDNFGSSTVTNSGGYTTTVNYSFSAGHRLVDSTAGASCSSCGANGTESFTYDANGRRTSVTDELNRVRNFAYDAAGNLSQVSRSIGANTQAWTYTYNSLGEVLTAADPLGYVTTNTYDAKGNLLSTQAPSPDGVVAGPLTTFTYDSKGQLLTVTDPRNKVTTLTYTPAGLIATIKDPLNNVTTFEYDTRGNRTAVVDALNHRTTFVYDAMDRLTSTIYADTTHIDNTYDSRSRLRSVIDQNGHSTSYTFDDADRLTQVTDALSNHTFYEYDNENNLTRITDAAGRHTDYSYDSKRRLTATTFPSGLQETYDYDQVGNLTAKTDRKNQRITYGYDAADRLTTKSYPDSTSVTFTYDLANRLTQAVDPTGTYGFTFDRIGRLTQTNTTYAFLPTRTFTVKSEYDAASNRTKMTDAENAALIYTYDNNNRLTNFGRFTFAYDALNRRSSITRTGSMGSNRTTTYTYDSLSRIAQIRHAGSGLYNGVGQIDYTYDAVGNRLTARYQEAAFYVPALTDEQNTYTYDGSNQLATSNFTRYFRYGSPQTGNSTYTYDLVGNRTSGLPAGAYDDSNHLTILPNGGSILYDANGSETQKTTIESGITKVRRYQWDFENRLVLLTKPDNSTTDFKYDPFGRRIKRGTDVFVYDGDDVVGDYQLNPDSTLAAVGSNVYGPGVDEVLQSHNYYTYSDALGSVRFTQNWTQGRFGTDFSYDDWGKSTTYPGAYPNPSWPLGDHRYTGRDFDQESNGDPDSGLMYYRARYYDPTVGRFISEDPIGFAGGVNFYTYVHNNPINMRDPYGLQDSASPWRVGWEWLSGWGPRTHNFTDGDPFTELLRHHQHVQQLIDEICSGKRGPSGNDPYGLHGLAGIPKYFRDYSTLLTGGTTGNLAVTYLGSYDLSYSVTKGVLAIHVYNPSTIASATHPPYFGYTPWWNKNIAKPLNNAFADGLFGTGMMSKTEQSFDFHENLASRCGCTK
jgi:RHS repeat-associated protein